MAVSHCILSYEKQGLLLHGDFLKRLTRLSGELTNSVLYWICSAHENGAGSCYAGWYQVVHATLAAVLQAMRVMRLVRVMKLFKHVEGRDPEDARSRAGQRMSMLSPQVQQSRVGQKLSELTTRRVVLGVLTMVFVLPYWDIANGVYGGSPTFDDKGLLSLHNQGLVDNTGQVFLQALEVRPASHRASDTQQLLGVSKHSPE